MTKNLDAIQLELFTLTEQRKLIRRQLRLLEKSRVQVADRIAAVQLHLKHLQLVETKRCSKCRCDLKPDFYYDDNRYKDGKYPYCKFCKIELVKERQRERKVA